MDNVPILFQSAILGLLVAAPVGPVAILCIQRTLRHGLYAGLQFGLGVALADAFFSCVAAFGLTVVMMIMVKASPWIALVGGVYLFYLGYKSFNSRLMINCSKDDSKRATRNNLLTAFFITVTNPMTVLSFVAMFSGVIAAKYSENLFRNGIEFVAGIFLGSLGWWVFLSLVVSVLRQKVKDKCLIIINTICSILLMLFGIFLIIKSAMLIIAH